MMLLMKGLVKHRVLLMEGSVKYIWIVLMMAGSRCVHMVGSRGEIPEGGPGVRSRFAVQARESKGVLRFGVQHLVLVSGTPCIRGGNVTGFGGKSRGGPPRKLTLDPGVFFPEETD